MLPPKPPSARVAAIDLGTNAFRLLIADVAANGHVRHRLVQRAIPRLGEGVGRTGRLNPDAVERALESLREFRSVVHRHEVEAVVAAATSAVREAENAADFLGRVKDEIGFDVEVISGAEEARRTWLGVQAGFSDRRQRATEAFILDIGGGSTEIIRIRDGEFDRAISLDLGVVKLSERCLRHDPPLDAERREMDAAIRDALIEAARLRDGTGSGILIGTAGTVTTAAAVPQVDGMRCVEAPRNRRARHAVEEIEATLARMTAAERRRLQRSNGAEDVVVAGLLSCA
jgi:exopolyphosphatase/guanosine-5'-triphosphate,3'-diphosphate pyrophosphatase